MPVNVIGTLKPKNNGKFPVAEAVDIKVTDNLRLDEALENKADLSSVNFALAGKADNSDINNLQSQISEIITPVTQDAEVQNARVGADGTSYQTLKARLDAENKSLYDDLNDVNHYIIAAANASGGVTYDYDIIEGYVYSVHNNGAGSVVIRCNVGETSYLIKDNVASGTTFDFTAEHTGKLRIYFYAAASVDVSGGKLKTIEKEVNQVEGNLEHIYNPYFVSSSTSTGVTYDYDIIEGTLYYVSNTGAGKVGIRCAFDDSSVLIKEINGGEQFTFTAENTGKLRIFYYAASSVEISSGVIAEIRDQISELESKSESTIEIVDDNKIIHKTQIYLKYVDTGYYVTNGGIGTIVSDEIQESSEVNSAVERVKKDDKFIITGQGGNAPKVWAFTDSEKRIVSVASQNVAINKEIVAPCDGFLYMGFYYTVPHSLHKIDVSFDREIEYTAPAFAVGTLNAASKISRDSEHRYNDIIGYYDMMLYEFNNYMSKEQIGTSQEPEGSFAEIDDNTYPIYVYKYRGRKTADADENKFILATGLHGDDIGKLGAGDGIEGVSSLAYLIKDILTNPSKNEMFEYIRDYCNIIICPVLNPWGYQNGFRHNGRGVDLNRNYSAGFVPNAEEYGCTSGPYAFSEAESVAWSEYIDTNHLNAKFMLEHHTRGGFSGITEQTDNRWNGVYPSGNKTLKKMVKMAGDKMVGRFGGTNDFADHPAQAIGQAYMYFYSEGMPTLQPEAFRSFGGNPQLSHGSDEVIKQLTVWDNELLSALIELYIRREELP